MLTACGLLLGACGDDSSSSGDITEVLAGAGLEGGGNTGSVEVAVDFAQVASKAHTHAFTDITGVPNASTTGASCPTGQTATGIDVSTGRVTCATPAPDSDTLQALSCVEGQVAQFIGGEWSCGAPGGGTSPWLQPEPDSVRFDGFVGIGRNPQVALDIETDSAQIALLDHAGGNAANIVLRDMDNAGAPLNIVYERITPSGAITATTFLAADNSMAYQTPGTAHRFKVSAAQEAMRIAPSGFVGIGTPAPAHLLDVSNGTATAFCDGASWVNASSRTFKEGIKGFAESDYRRIRRWLDETQVVWYRYRNDRDPRTRVGLIAEDVPDVLATADRTGISTADAIGFLTATAKQLASENDRLKSDNDALNERLRGLEQRLVKLERTR